MRWRFLFRTAIIKSLYPSDFDFFIQCGHCSHIVGVVLVVVVRVTIWEVHVPSVVLRVLSATPAPRISESGKSAIVPCLSEDWLLFAIRFITLTVPPVEAWKFALAWQKPFSLLEAVCKCFTIPYTRFVGVAFRSCGIVELTIFCQPIVISYDIAQ